MAQALNKTKRRIASVKNTKKITEAMELVATVKLKKFKNIMEKNSNYVFEMENVISHLFEMLDKEQEIVYLKEGAGEKDLLIVINSNLGLCASYNSNIFSYIKNNVKKENTVLLPIGLKGEINYKNEGYELIEDFISLNEKLSYDDCVKFGRRIHTDFVQGKYKSISILYTKYINSLKTEPFEKKLLPISIDKKTKILGYNPIYDPNVKTLIEELVPIALNSTIYQAIIESQVSEQASRRIAMENANDNADEIIDKLTIEFNKARQAAITQEITEVVGSQNK